MLRHSNMQLSYLSIQNIFITQKRNPIPSKELLLISSLPSSQENCFLSLCTSSVFEIHPCYTMYQPFISCLLFFFLNGRISDIWKFPGQGSNQSCNCQPQPQPQPQPPWIQASSATYASAWGNPDPKPTDQGQGSNPHPHGYQSGS